MFQLSCIIISESLHNGIMYLYLSRATGELQIRKREELEKNVFRSSEKLNAQTEKTKNTKAAAKISMIQPKTHTQVNIYIYRRTYILVSI